MGWRRWQELWQGGLVTTIEGSGAARLISRVVGQSDDPGLACLACRGSVFGSLLRCRRLAEFLINSAAIQRNCLRLMFSLCASTPPALAAKGALQPRFALGSCWLAEAFILFTFDVHRLGRVARMR